MLDRIDQSVAVRRATFLLQEELANWIKVRAVETGKTQSRFLADILTEFRTLKEPKENDESGAIHETARDEESAQLKANPGTD